jgi:hypothetical protein
MYNEMHLKFFYPENFLIKLDCFLYVCISFIWQNNVFFFVSAHDIIPGIYIYIYIYTHTHTNIYIYIFIYIYIVSVQNAFQMSK